MINRILGGLGRTLIFSGIVLLLFVGYQLWGTGLDESGHQEDLTRSLGHSLGVDTAKTDAEEEDAAAIDEKITAKLSSIDPTKAPPAEIPKEGDPEGKIEIPAIGLRSKTFVEGVAKADLRKGPGHYPSTPLPGNPGNAAIAGHRTTYGAPFNRIDELKPGDQIITYTLQGKFVYEVLESPPERRAGDEGGTWGPGWFAVKPNDVSVLAPTDDNRLTLTACHPKYSAKLRIIVQAKLVAEPAEAPTTTAPTTDAATGADGTDDAQTDRRSRRPRISSPATPVSSLPPSSAARDRTRLDPWRCGAVPSSQMRWWDLHRRRSPRSPALVLLRTWTLPAVVLRPVGCGP